MNRFDLNFLPVQVTCFTPLFITSYLFQRENYLKVGFKIKEVSEWFKGLHFNI
jgi:hypothetical protein